MNIRMIVAAVFFILGTAVYITSVIGIYKFRYVLNKMHCAALGDTLGILFMAIGAVIFYGFTFSALKAAAVVAFLWISSPIASHMTALLETRSNREAAGTEYEEMDISGKENK
ncbi:MAG: monovalent cation/H(+) antiporter subunit G [Lachnospiraceae bacterium]|nr:monovalent cation/H(+) antiporter subunit G [Lachnospiraceae bacterium]